MNRYAHTYTCAISIDVAGRVILTSYEATEEVKTEAKTSRY
jgi:hypothetical protein